MVFSDPAAVGAFFSGVAAAITAVISSRVAHKRAEKACQQRIKEVRAAIHEGYEMKEHEEHE